MMLEELDKKVAEIEGYLPCKEWKLENMGSAGGPVFWKNCKHEKCYPDESRETINGTVGGCPQYSTNWNYGGPLIEKYDIALEPDVHDTEKWTATIGGDGIFDYGYGLTPLIAVCKVIIKQAS